MSIIPKINQRIIALKLNLDEVQKASRDLRKDAYEELGIEYGKSYPDDESTRMLFEKIEILKNDRKEKLFTTILNFSQVFSSLKNYLAKQYPNKANEFDLFFYKEMNKSISRMDLSNDLKHNPEKDVIFDFRVTKTEIIKEPGKEIHRSFMSQSWFYKGVEVVEHCNNLYTDTMNFVKHL